MCLSLWYWQNKAKLSACLSGLWRCSDGGLGSCGYQTSVRWCRTQSVITEHAVTSTNSERQTQAINKVVNGLPPLGSYCLANDKQEGCWTDEVTAGAVSQKATRSWRDVTAARRKRIYTPALFAVLLCAHLADFSPITCCPLYIR